MICLFFCPRKKKKKNRAFFFSYCIFATILRGKIAPELTIRVSSPARAWKNNFGAFGSYFFLVFVSFCPPLFLFLFLSFRFLLFSFTFFHHFFQEQKTRKQKVTQKNEERRCFVSFMSEKERSVYRPFQPLLLAFTYETIFKAVQGTYCHLTLRAWDRKLRDQFEAN